MSVSNDPDWVKYAKVGDKVVCIDDSPGAIDYGDCRLRLNGIYTLSSITFEFAEAAVSVEECILDGYDDDGEWFEGYLRASRFRPLTRTQTDISVFTALLDNAPAPTPRRVPA